MEGACKHRCDDFKLIIPFQYPADDKSDNMFYGGKGCVFQDEDNANAVYLESLEEMEQ